MAVVKESRPGENRVAVVPEVAGRLIKAGADVVIETGAGEAARFADDRYREAGASVKGDAAGDRLRGRSRGQGAGADDAEVAIYPSGVSVISFLQPLADLDVVRALAAKGATVYSLDLLPRISRAQSMDALSSQSTVAGYRAGLAAAEHLAKFFPMFMTAAGTVPPAKVLVMGAGVAGLQAIATSRRLGAVVRAYDVRAAAKEEVQSLGAKFVDLGLDTREGVGRLRPRADGRGAGPPAGAVVRRGCRLRRGHHHGADPWATGAAARLRGHGRRDERRRGGDRPGRRLGWELRAHQAR